jgi:hypothetical protein
VTWGVEPNIDSSVVDSAWLARNLVSLKVDVVDVVPGNVEVVPGNVGVAPVF